MRSIKHFFNNSESNNPNETIGLCLSGGGALGFAHIGVLQALHDYRIFPQIISGTSMGSIIGSLYAAGYTPAQMIKFIDEGKLYRVTKLMTFQPAFWKAGLTSQAAIMSLINDLIPNNSFEKLEKPMHICVSNLTTGKYEIIEHSNKLDMWIGASCSIPGIFNGMKINDMTYVDGGLLNNFPAQPLREKCSVIIGSDVIPHSSVMKNQKSRDTLLSSLRVGIHQNSLPGREMCDYLIEPKAIEKFHEFSFENFQSIYHYGYKATVQFIADNPEILRLQQPIQPD
ncbi:MAG TPA: patatin-like phospholipase family protein [Paludibacteraceae bacterium]|nr:patatin-like phospholipase family protein [Paludibacteraceae bacterium]HPS10737.1 patatin-like phospholipase family protein [Paludibacteraceae bacterium]